MLFLTLTIDSCFIEIASDGLKGRVFEVSLADLQNDEVAFRKFKLITEDVQGKNCLTNFHGMDLTRDKMCSMVKKWQVRRKCMVLQCAWPKMSWFHVGQEHAVQLRFRFLFKSVVFSCYWVWTFELEQQQWWWCLVTQLSPNCLCDPMDCRWKSSCPWDFPGKNVEMGAISFSRGSSQPEIQPVFPALQVDSLPISHPGSPWTEFRI